MRVNPNNDTSEIIGGPSQAARRPARLEQDNPTLTSDDKLSQALEQTPQVRAEAVARAKALVRDPAYPPQVLINKLAALLAVHLSTQEASSRNEPGTDGDNAP